MVTVKGSKRQKHHDKDKYYHLAKEQGLRSRAAFKLTQINRKYPCLEQCETAVLDLCAAPGGWTQVAARTCPKSTVIVAVDILPIRALKGYPNVTTLIGDITTDKCKAEIRQAIWQGCGQRKQQLVDLVLHDGAPNVGAEFGKDAYEQNELAVHALKCATQHLRPGGTFVTKIYRSRDYASYHWVLQQLFDSVSVLKPKASRQQSAEIFLIAQQYKAPAKLDPRFLDPKHIFEAVEGNTTGGGERKEGSSSAGSGVSIFHKNFDKPKRQRSGYDMNFLDSTMRHVTPVHEFVSASFKDAVQILGQSTGMEFYCADGVASQKANSFFLHHPLTTGEIQTNLSDLRVLNKSDFKALLNWRVKMQEAMAARKDDDDDSEHEEEEDADDSGNDPDSDEEEEQVQKEISEMRDRRIREKKRKKKKERAQASKRRRQAAFGMDLNAIDVPDNDRLFSLASITTKAELATAAEVNLDQVTDEQVWGNSDDDDDIVIGKPEEDGVVPDDVAERLRRRERDLEEAYELYLQTTKNATAKSGTKMQKHSKKLQRQKLVEEATEDQELMMSQKSGIRQDTLAYARLLQGPKGSDNDDSDDDDDNRDSDSDDDDDDDGFHAKPVTPEVHAQLQRQRKVKAASHGNPLLPKFDEEPSSVRAARWFSNPLFESIQKKALEATKAVNEDDDGNSNKEEKDDDDDDDHNGDDEDGSDDDKNNSVPEVKGKSEVRKESKGTKGTKTKPSAGMSADEVLAMMPMTDKQKRHIKRLKQIAHDEKKQARRAQKTGETSGDFEIAPAAGDEDKSENDNDQTLAHLNESEKRKVLEAREQIKAGMGKALTESTTQTNSTSFEVVGTDASGNQTLPVKDDRKYDSEHEDYDSDDYAETLALGTMMLRRSKEKAFLDASYNRYAWNDPQDLPDWFVDDEKKNYRPQLPIPPALLAKMKEKMMSLAVKPIQKVAEARARKNKRAQAKLADAKKKAEAVANSSEMSDAMKLKAISKALRGQETKKPGKTYVVAKRGRGANAPGKGVKVVDKRMKSDKRAADRIEKKRKKGKQNGLTGSKRRRHHK